jgi:hypothetical protein
VALDEESRREAAHRHRGRVEERLAGDDLFGLADVRDDLLRRLTGARRDAGESERGAGVLEEVAPIEPVRDPGRVAKFLIASWMNREFA